MQQFKVLIGDDSSRIVTALHASAARQLVERMMRDGIIPADDIVAVVPVPQCQHSWVAGVMVVHDEDLATVAASRTVECERCELTVGPDTPLSVIDAERAQ